MRSGGSLTAIHNRGIGAGDGEVERRTAMDHKIVCLNCGSDMFYISPNGDIICVTCDYRYELVMTISTSIRPSKEPKKEDSDERV